MERSRFLQTVRYLVHSMVLVSVPAEATTAVDKVSVKSTVNELPYRLVDFLTVEMLLLGGLVLLAFVLIARKPGVH